MLSVRIAFNKKGALKFISHLDLLRTVKKIFIRAGIPLVYSEGFNPHAKIVFSSTLSLGVESFAEFADVKLNTELSPEEIKAKIIPHSPEALEIKDVYIPTNEFKEIDKSRYELYFDIKESLEKIRTEFTDVFKVERVRNKKSRNPFTEEVDILPSLTEIEITQEENGYVKISVTLPSNSGDYINPELIASRLKKVFTVEDYYFIKREAINQNGKIFR